MRWRSHGVSARVSGKSKKQYQSSSREKHQNSMAASAKAAAYNINGVTRNSNQRRRGISGSYQHRGSEKMASSGISSKISSKYRAESQHRRKYQRICNSANDN